MPSEPKKPIEELLEASTKARRAEFGSGPKMPNPMRARLHEEIARLARRGDEATPRLSWLRIAWPRLVIGAAAAAVVIGAPIIYWRTQQRGGETFRLTMNQPAAAARAKEPEIQSANLAKAGAASSSEMERFAEVKIAPAAPVPAAQGVASNEKSSAELSSAPPASSAFVATEKKEVTNLKQQFSQRVARQAVAGASKAKTAAYILESFELEQNGAQIRVVDADGSTYTGLVEPAAREKLRDESAVAKPSEAPPPSPNEFNFRAAGYNATLKKSVTLEANYRAIASSEHDRAAGKASQESQPARITGTAKINGESPMPVDAVSVPAGH